MKFAIINDFHLSSPDTGWENGVQRKLVGQSERLLTEFIQKMNTVDKPEFVVNLGDSIEDVKDKEGDAHYFRLAIKLLYKLKMPVYFLIGNHDIKTHTSDQIAEMLGYDAMHYSFDKNGYHFIALSFEDLPRTQTPSLTSPFISENVIEWLKSDLAKTSKPTVVFCHHGLADDDMVGNFWFEKIPHRALLGNRRQIRQIFEKSGKVKGVFTGHQHWNRMFVHNSIPYFTVTSLVENFNNDGIASEAHTIVNIDTKKIWVDVRGNDRANYEFVF